MILSKPKVIASLFYGRSSICEFLPHFGCTWEPGYQEPGKTQEKGESLSTVSAEVHTNLANIYFLFSLCLGTGAGSLKEKNQLPSSPFIFSLLVLAPVVLSDDSRSPWLTVYSLIFHSFIHLFIYQSIFSWGLIVDKATELTATENIRTALVAQEFTILTCFTKTCPPTSFWTSGPQSWWQGKRLPPGDIWQCLQTFLLTGRAGFPGMQWVHGRGAARYLSMHRRDLTWEIQFQILALNWIYSLLSTIFYI